MRRLPLAFLLGVGALVGFGSGVHQLRWQHWARRAAFERHIADVCIEAARTGQAPSTPGAWHGPGTAPGW